MTTLADEIARWLGEKVDSAGVNGVAVGLSGGIDSAVVATLSVRALGTDRVSGVIMPAYSQHADVHDARLVADHLGLDPLDCALDPFEGLAALLGMLNSCTPQVVCVNIDNGFGAGFFAALVTRKS
jgi:NAD+ synthase